MVKCATPAARREERVRKFTVFNSVYLNG